MGGRLRADFRRYYGMTWPPPEVGAAEAADMVAYLPPESAVFRHLFPEGAQTPELDLLREMEYHLSWLVWSKTKDATRNMNAPERIEFPWEHNPDRPDSLEWDEAAAFLGWEAEMARYFQD